MQNIEIKRYFFLQNHPDSHSQLLRYYMIGIFNEENKFTGIVYDYMGGGTSADEYFVDGVSTQDLDENGDPVFNDCDEASDEMEAKYPGLYEELVEVLEEYTFTEENEDGWFDYYVKADKMKLFNDNGDYVGPDTIDEPIQIGNTSFK